LLTYGQMDGTVLNPEKLVGSDLSISIVTADVQPAASETEFPVWGNTRVLERLTF
jgi:hypothetical protein